jgi:hypothetical protein
MGLVEQSALAKLLSRLWDSPDLWHVEGGWLSVNLPQQLPARVAPASLSHDKIASDTDVLSATSEEIIWRLRRGRRGSSDMNDENNIIESGLISLVRHRWNYVDPLDSNLFFKLNMT